MFHRIETILGTEQPKLYPRFGAKKFTAFICNGLWAYIDAGYNEGCDVAQLRMETKLILVSLLRSEMFVRED